MKIKIFSYLAVVPIILGLSACANKSTPSATTTHQVGITLIPSTREDNIISGLVPEGWVEVKPGHFQRMLGNVWEWVAHGYEDSYYSDSPTENPTRLPFGTECTQRGGAWYDNESWGRTTVRHSIPPLTCRDDLGFRRAFPASP
jgi:hypothetical protein